MIFWVPWFGTEYIEPEGSKKKKSDWFPKGIWSQPQWCDFEFKPLDWPHLSQELTQECICTRMVWKSPIPGTDIVPKFEGCVNLVSIPVQRPSWTATADDPPDGKKYVSSWLRLTLRTSISFTPNCNLMQWKSSSSDPIFGLKPTKDQGRGSCVPIGFQYQSVCLSCALWFELIDACRAHCRCAYRLQSLQQDLARPDFTMRPRVLKHKTPPHPLPFTGFNPKMKFYYKLCHRIKFRFGEGEAFFDTGSVSFNQGLTKSLGLSVFERFDWFEFQPTVFGWWSGLRPRPSANFLTCRTVCFSTFCLGCKRRGTEEAVGRWYGCLLLHMRWRLRRIERLMIESLILKKEVNVGLYIFTKASIY